MTLYVKKLKSKKGNPFIAIVGIDCFGQCFVTFDTQVIMRMSGLSAKDIGNMSIDDSFQIGEV